VPAYLALTYTPDVDWTRPEYGEELAEYREFGQAVAAVIKGSGVPRPRRR